MRVNALTGVRREEVKFVLMTELGWGGDTLARCRPPFMSLKLTTRMEAAFGCHPTGSPGLSVSSKLTSVGQAGGVLFLGDDPV